MGCLLHWSSKFDKRFLICWPNNLGDFIEIFIGWFIKLSIQTFQLLIEIKEGLTLCIIIEDVHQFISHCLISLDLWVLQIVNSNLSYPFIGKFVCTLSSKQIF